MRFLFSARSTKASRTRGLRQPLRVKERRNYFGVPNKRTESHGLYGPKVFVQVLEVLCARLDSFLWPLELTKFDANGGAKVFHMLDRCAKAGQLPGDEKSVRVVKTTWHFAPYIHKCSLQRENERVNLCGNCPSGLRLPRLCVVELVSSCGL